MRVRTRGRLFRYGRTREREGETRVPFCEFRYSTAERERLWRGWGGEKDDRNEISDDKPRPKDTHRRRGGKRAPKMPILPGTSRQWPRKRTFLASRRIYKGIGWYNSGRSVPRSVLLEIRKWSRGRRNETTSASRRHRDRCQAKERGKTDRFSFFTDKAKFSSTKRHFEIFVKTC